MKKLNTTAVVAALETIALGLMIVAFATGCMKVGKGCKITITDEMTHVKPYPTMDAIVSTVEPAVTTTATTVLQQVSVTETTTTGVELNETTTSVQESVAVPISFEPENHSNTEDSANVDVTETKFETYDYGYYPSVANGYITEEERIFLCNTVGTEYGADWVSLYDKALVVDTVMTRVDQGCWTNGLESNVYNVLTAPNQYNPWYAEGYYHDCVTQSCIDAVEYYFQHRDEFPHYTSFYGDGVENHFYN